jgi:hypothetical protein
MKLNQIFTGLLATGVVSLVASADVLNIDFNAERNLDRTFLYVGRGAAPDDPGNTFWNRVTTGANQNHISWSDTSPKHLSTGEGSLLTVGLTLTRDQNADQLRDWAVATGAMELQPPYTDLMRDYVFVSTSQANFNLGINAHADGTISGLIPGNLYDLYFYGQGDNSVQNAMFTIGGVSKTTSFDGVAGGDGVLTENVEYVLFENIEADSEGNIHFGWTGVNSRFAAMNGLQIVGDLTRNENSPPSVEDRVPEPHAAFHTAENGMSFRITTLPPNTVSPQGIRLILNGIDVSENLAADGGEQDLGVTFSGLSANVHYTALVIASDEQGRTSTNAWAFNTFRFTGPVLVEAEDYNYDAAGDTCDDVPPGFRLASGLGGAFLEPWEPNRYQNLIGMFNVDYFSPVADTNELYRCSITGTNAIGVAPSQDKPREPYVAANGTEYDLNRVRAGQWMNYTRTFNGNYHVYLRVQSGAPQIARLDRVTDHDPATPAGQVLTENQSTASAGIFVVPFTGGHYIDVPLTVRAANRR